MEPGWPKSPGGLAASDCGGLSRAPERSGRLPPTPDSQASEGENEPTPTRIRNILAAGISTIVNVMSLNDQSLEATSIAAPANLIEHESPRSWGGERPKVQIGFSSNCEYGPRIRGGRDSNPRLSPRQSDAIHLIGTAGCPEVLSRPRRFQAIDLIRPRRRALYSRFA